MRTQTSAEIKSMALKLMEEGGPDAISLRAIARGMGMTAGTIYGYYPTRDDLITTLIRDVYTELVEVLEKARDAVPEQETANRVLAWGEAFRNWSLANPQGFRLVYGEPVAGYHAPEGGPAPEAVHRACAGLTGMTHAAWPHAEPLQTQSYEWDDFDPDLVLVVRGATDDLTPGALALALRLWGRMHGLVTLEVYGHLRGPSSTNARLFRAELDELITTSLGLKVA